MHHRFRGLQHFAVVASYRRPRKRFCVLWGKLPEGEGHELRERFIPWFRPHTGVAAGGGGGGRDNIFIAVSPQGVEDRIPTGRNLKNAVVHAPRGAPGGPGGTDNDASRASASKLALSPGGGQSVR